VLKGVNCWVVLNLILNCAFIVPRTDCHTKYCGTGYENYAMADSIAKADNQRTIPVEK